MDALRRTKVSIIYKATGDLRAAQILLGHKTPFDTSARGMEDALAPRREAEDTEM
jgi:hypothetical protein